MNEDTSLVVGGSNGIGLAISSVLAEKGNVIIVDKSEPDYNLSSNISFCKFDLLSSDYSIFKQFENIKSLIITAGFGRLALFEDIEESEIIRQMTVNTIAPMRIINHFYGKIKSKNDFYCAVMVSISGFMSSPFFSTYGASKAALKIFIESLNTELTKSDTTNRILNVSPGSLKGTRFNNGKNNLNDTIPIAREIIKRMYEKKIYGFLNMKIFLRKY